MYIEHISKPMYGVPARKRCAVANWYSVAGKPLKTHVDIMGGYGERISIDLNGFLRISLQQIPSSAGLSCGKETAIPSYSRNRFWSYLSRDVRRS